MNTETYEPTTEPAPIEEPTIHLARCAECGHAVRFRPNSSGTGFILVDADTLYGVGALGQPLCPDGHGEMEIADDRLPIEQAITQTAERIDATTQRLPFPSPPFNYEGVLRSLCTKRHEIAQLEKRVEGCKEKLKNAKEDLDQSNVELGKMLDQYERDEQDRLAEIARREAAAAAGHPEDTTLVRCAWELAHPDEDCPMCADEKLRPLAPDAALHVEQVDRYLYLEESDSIVELMAAAGIRIAQDVVNAWSVEDRAVAQAWAEAENGLADKPENHQRPAILGTAHVADSFTTSEAEPGETFQCCRECGARLISYPTGSDNAELSEIYPAGTLVGVDCPGAKEPARYAKRKKKS